MVAKKAEAPSGVLYDVHVHTAKGVDIVQVTAESGDKAAELARQKHGDPSAVVRGVAPAA